MFKWILSKEIKGELYTWKSTIWLFVSSLIFSLTSYLLLTNKELSLLNQTEMLWLLSKIIVGIGLLISIIESSMVITSEFEKETAEGLFLSPLKLKDFILGKFLSVLFLWFLIFIVAIPYMSVASAGTHLIWPFLAFTLLLGSILIAGFTMLSFGLSLLFRYGKNVMTTSLVIALALTVPATFTSTLKNNPLSGLLSKVNPVDNVFASLDNVLVDYHISLMGNWIYLLPLIIFLLVALIFLIYGAKRFNKDGVIKND